MSHWYDPALARSLRGLRLPTHPVRTTAATGRHRSNLSGSGMEFAQYRGYQPGDELRRVDWKLFARSDRVFVREAETDATMSVQIVLDCSASMAHDESGVVKFDAARRIAAALAELALDGGDAPALLLLGKPPSLVAAGRGRQQLERIVRALNSATPNGVLDLHPMRDRAGSPAAGGVMFMITDWHDRDNQLVPALLQATRYANIMTLRSPRERDIDYGSPVTLEDLETGARLTVTRDAATARTSADAERRRTAARAGIEVIDVDPTIDLATQLRAWLRRIVTQ